MAVRNYNGRITGAAALFLGFSACGFLSVIPYSTSVERGPLVYCAEGVDNGGTALNSVIPPGADFKAVWLARPLLDAGRAFAYHPL